MASNRRRYFERTYGLTPHQHAEMLKRGCDACPSRENLRIDHKDGKLRGVLCDICNLTIGQAEDDPDRLEALAAYLRRAAVEAKPIVPIAARRPTVQHGFKKQYEIDHAEITRLYWSENRTLAEIAEHFGCSVGNVLRIMIKHGIPRRPSAEVPRRARVDIDPDELRALRETGMSQRALAEHFNCAVLTIQRKLRKAGIP